MSEVRAREMDAELIDLKERQAAQDARFDAMGEKMAEVLAEVRAISRLLRGNGEDGLVAQLEIAHERIKALQTQLKWIAGLLGAVFAALLKTVFD